MKISGFEPPSLKIVTPTAGGTHTAQQNGLKAEADCVEISSEARIIGWAAEQIRKMPEVDLEKVAKIKVMLEKGAYRVDSRKAAAKMLEEALLSER